MRIVNFEPGYFEELLGFCKRMWPRNTENYLRYRLFQFPEQVEENKVNLLVLNDENKIIGCNFFFPTKAKLFGKEEKIFWSHDTMIDPEYRKDGFAGMLLISELMQMKNVFGCGLSDINYKIHKRIKAHFLGSGNQFIIVSFWSFKLVLYKLHLLDISNVKDYHYPEIIQVGDITFKKITDITQLNIPENGYWNPELDIDFIRDAHFLKNRFFDNYNKYEFYALTGCETDECYFVVKAVMRRGLQFLQLVDFRFNMNKKYQYQTILKAVLKIIRMNRLPFAMMKTNFLHKKFSFFPLVIKLTGSIHFLTYNKIKENVSFLITFADSDSDPDFKRN
jgi:hypothetical protein